MKRTIRNGLAIGLLAVFVLTAGGVHAENLLGKNLHYFQPPSDGSGVILTYGSEALTWFGMHYGGYADDALDPLTVIMNNGDEERLIENQLGINALYAIGITRYLNLGIAIPMIPYRTFNDDFKPSNAHTTVMEDIRLDVKGIILDRKRRCLGVAVNVTGTVPIAPYDNSFASDGGFGVLPRLIVDIGREWWTVAFNAGYRHNVETQSDVLDVEVNNELLFNLGSIFRLGNYGQYGQILVDTAWRTPLKEFFSNEDSRYGEMMAAYRYFLGDYTRIALTLGGGVGILDGVGTPTGRVFLGVTVYEHRLERGR